MSDLICIADLEVQARIGVPEAERAKPQRLLVSVEMAVKSLGPAAKTDDVKLTVDYAIVAERIRDLAERKPRKLLERLAEEIAEDLLGNFAMEKVAVEIKKFVLPETAHVAVRIERTK
ncbi:MAG: dihydroneopterin aldolase [Methylacidiphilales bacterium]|nr:dihydroneopterin aldolase [Candidatus Methylacidiphilales bacterium]